MNSKAMWKIAGLALVAAAGAVVAVACDSGSNNTPVTGVDGGEDGGGSSSGGSSSGGSSSGASSSSSGGSSSGASSGGDAGDAGDTGAPCTPDASAHCNSCASIGNNTRNVCAPDTINCIPYNNAEAGVPSPLP